MDWHIKALIQKALSLTNIGDKLNHHLITFNKNYHRNVVTYQTHECLRKFRYCNLDLRQGQTALEIGTGYSIVSAVVLALIGFEKVITVDVTPDISFKTFKKQLPYLNGKKFLEDVSLNSIYSREEIKRRIDFLNNQASFTQVFEFLNIIYIAPYRFSDIERIIEKVDYISSQVVLEHIHPDVLETLFEKTKLWLNAGGYCVHTINFIDHFANPGFFRDKGISEFNFLRYSDRYWSFWSGNPIAYTNRLSYRYYLELSKKNNITIVDFKGENYRERIELDRSLIHKDILKKYQNAPDPEDLTKYQRGTLILHG